MPKLFLGSGWGFPVSVDPQTGKINTAAYEESVRQAIWIILGTARGERVMRPDFGCRIYDLVFENITASSVAKITQAVREALLMFETRIDVLEVQVQPENGGEVLLISVEYEVRATNNVFNLVYPFYLERNVG
jgi:Bacteriophage baseplate protein W